MVNLGDAMLVMVPRTSSSSPLSSFSLPSLLALTLAVVTVKVGVMVAVRAGDGNGRRQVHVKVQHRCARSDGD